MHREAARELGLSPREGLVSTGRLASCPSGKKGYPTRADALHVERMIVRHGRAKNALNAYRCDACRSWHLGGTRRPTRSRGSVRGRPAGRRR